MISEELINYKTAQLAKQAGFNIPVHTCYNNNGKLMETSDLLNTYCEGGLDFDEFFMNYNNKPELEKYQKSELYSAPTQSLLQRWIREVHNIFVSCSYNHIKNNGTYYMWFGIMAKSCDMSENFDTYELALEQALQEALTIIINRKETSNEQV